MRTIYILFSILIIFHVSIDFVQGHGMMLEPVGRASRWRIDRTAPANYDDNGVRCGGYPTQLGDDNDCGICGDSVDDPKPRDHELGGFYGQGTIVETYREKEFIWVGIKITANHLGYYYMDICNLDKFKVESKECFAEHGSLQLVEGGNTFNVETNTGWVNSTIVPPKNFSCKHCVLRWTYVTGNNWGVCSNGDGRIGCGPQETFRSCADIQIL